MYYVEKQTGLPPFLAINVKSDILIHIEPSVKRLLWRFNDHVQDWAVTTSLYYNRYRGLRFHRWFEIRVYSC